MDQIITFLCFAAASILGFYIGKKTLSNKKKD